MPNILTWVVAPAARWRHEREVRERTGGRRCEEVAVVVEHVLVPRDSVHDQVIEHAGCIGIERERSIVLSQVIVDRALRECGGVAAAASPEIAVVVHQPA